LQHGSLRTAYTTNQSAYVRAGFGGWNLALQFSGLFGDGLVSGAFSVRSEAISAGRIAVSLWRAFLFFRQPIFLHRSGERFEWTSRSLRTRLEQVLERFSV